MHAWEAIQKSIDYIEDNLAEPLEIETLAQVASLSVFYYQRLFTRLVKISVREYIKLRRLARAAHLLKDRKSRVIEVAFEVGFSSHAVFSRTFKTVYGLSPSLYQKAPIGLQNFDKPDLSLGYIVTEEGHPLISEGVVLEIQKKETSNQWFFMALLVIIHLNMEKCWVNEQESTLLMKFGVIFIKRLQISLAPIIA